MSEEQEHTATADPWQTAHEMMRASDLIASTQPSGEEYAKRINAAQLSYFAGDYELAAHKVEDCLRLQQARLSEGLRGTGDSTLFTLAADLGISDLEQGDGLRELLVANKSAYYE